MLSVAYWLLAKSRTDFNRKAQENLIEKFSQLKNLSKLSFPKGTKLLWYSYDKGIDSLIRAKLAFTQAGWQSFIKQPLIGQPIFEPIKCYHLGENRIDWNPKNFTSLTCTQISLPQAKVVNLGFVQHDSTLVTVFLIWHET